jgi:hypothetical protein
MSSPPRMPEPPATLPNGDLDCPEDPGGEPFVELNEFAVGTPEVLAERRRVAVMQRGAVENAVLVAAAVEQFKGAQRETVVTPLPATLTSETKVPTPKQAHLRNVRALLDKTPPGATNQELCGYYNQAGLRPVGWKITSYLDVWGNKRLEARFRKEKSEALKLN